MKDDLEKYIKGDRIIDMGYFDRIYKDDVPKLINLYEEWRKDRLELSLKDYENKWGEPGL